MELELKHGTKGNGVALPEELDIHAIFKPPIPEITRPTNNHASVIAIAKSRSFTHHEHRYRMPIKTVEKVSYARSKRKCITA